MKKEEKVVQKNRLTKPFLIAAAIISLTAGAKILYSNPTERNAKSYSITAGNKLDSELQKAIETPSLRQTYLDNLISSNNIPFSSGVIYDPDGRKMRDYYLKLLTSNEANPQEIQTAMESVEASINDQKNTIRTPTIIELNGTKIRAPIYLNEAFFSPQSSLLNSQDTKHIIEKHEGRHTEQAYSGLEKLGYMNEKTVISGMHNGKIDQRIISPIMEIDALGYEIKSIESKWSNPTEQCKRSILGEYRKNRELLERILPHSSSLQKKLIEGVLEKNPKR